MLGRHRLRAAGEGSESIGEAGMSIRLGQLVERLGGRLKGDAQIEVVGIAPLDTATSSHMTFLSNPRLRSQAEQTQAAALILSEADDAAVADKAAGGESGPPQQRRHHPIPEQGPGG